MTTHTQSLSERLREAASTWRDARHAEFLREAADEIDRLREALQSVDAKVLEDLDRATRNRGARVAT